MNEIIKRTCDAISNKDIDNAKNIISSDGLVRTVSDDFTDRI